MRIFYAVQATGNGHIARAIELMPFLQQYGKVDVFLSGSNSSLPATEVLPVAYRSNGISLFYNNTGGLSYWKMFRHCSLRAALKDARNLPLEKYDIIINDFESITSLACRMRKIPSVNFGHQASFNSLNAPRPQKKSISGEWILQRYATASKYIGLHFKQYDDFIYPPVIKNNILEAAPVDHGHITVYLPHYSDWLIAKKLKSIPHTRFEVFTKRVAQPEANKNITFLPIHNETFTQSMIHAHGIITGAGFETPAEALYLKKKLMAMPIKGQYEQLCNAEALKEFNVPVIPDLDDEFSIVVKYWLQGNYPKSLQLNYSTKEIVAKVIKAGLELRHTWMDTKAPHSISPTLSY